VIARSRNTSRRLLAATLWIAIVWIAIAGCSDANRESSANSAQPPETPPAPAASAPDSAPDAGARAEPKAVLPPEGVEHPAASDRAQGEIARGAASDVERQPDDVDWSGGDPGHGGQLYSTHCAICHGSAGGGDGIATPSLNPKPRDFRDGRFYLDTNANNRTGEDVDLARVILFGPAAFGGTREMVPWREAFSDDDVRDLIAHIRTLAAVQPAAPAPHGPGAAAAPSGAPAA
jgi:mono/diheme cytochrome c family protein